MNLVQETLEAEEKQMLSQLWQGSWYALVLFVSLLSWLLLHAEGKMAGLTRQGLFKLALLLQRQQCHHEISEISGNGFFLSSVVVTASDETDFYRQGGQLAKLKIHCFHLNRGEWFRIKSKLEHQILVFLATGHSHFWENKRTEDCHCFLAVCFICFQTTLPRWCQRQV